VSPVRYELGFYIPEDGILHIHRRENLKSYTVKLYVHSPLSHHGVVFNEAQRQLYHYVDYMWAGYVKKSAI
jgi:hypothetical protein